MDNSTLIQIVIVIFSTGILYERLNRMGKDITETKNSMNKHIEKDDSFHLQTEQRITRLETNKK